MPRRAAGGAHGRASTNRRSSTGAPRPARQFAARQRDAERAFKTLARHYEPAALEGALRAIPASKLEDIAGELRWLPPNWMEKQRPRLIGPARPNEARNAVAIVARIFRGRQRTWSR